jgi:uncharacterized protein with PIN domain
MRDIRPPRLEASPRKGETDMALCPHCEKEVMLDSTKKDKADQVQKEIKGIIKKEVMYSCPYCGKTLGFAFFFGGMTTGRP